MVTKAKVVKAKNTKATATKVVKEKKTSKKAEVLKDMDRRALAAKARQLKTELLAIRFNIQNPSLKEFRSKRQELAQVLASLN